MNRSEMWRRIDTHPKAWDMIVVGGGATGVGVAIDAAARGYVDAIVYPEETRDVLALALRAALSNPGPHLGPFVLPPNAI